MRCYKLATNLGESVTRHKNLAFLCDVCLKLAKPTNMVQICNALESVASDLSEIKSGVVDLKSAVSSQTTQMPPPGIFPDMLKSLAEITNSLKLVAETQNASANAINEANNASFSVLHNIQSTLANKEASPTPLVNPSELSKLMTDVRTALENNGRNSARTMPNSFGTPITPSGGGRKRLRETIPYNTMHSPDPSKRAKPMPQTVCTGPANTDLLTVEQPGKDSQIGKSMVASRFAPQTDPSKILAHVKAGLELAPDSDVVLVRSLAPRNRPLSELTFISFKVTVPDEHFDKLMEPSFWPAKTTIRDFEQRASPSVASFP